MANFLAWKVLFSIATTKIILENFYILLNVPITVKDKSGKGKWSRRPWLNKTPKRCTRCEGDTEVCGQPICVNDNGHAKSFKSVCEAMKYLKNRKKLKAISMGLGDCKALFSSM